MAELGNNRRLVGDIIKKETKPIRRAVEVTPQKPRRKTTRTSLKRANIPKRNNLKPYVRFAAILVVILVFGLIVNALSSVLVKITPQQQLIQVDTAFRASADEEEKNLKIVPLEVMQLSETQKKTFKTTGIKEMEQKSSGKIKIFNAHSSQSQALVATTRFETPDGKIYRIPKSIVVPGAKIEDGEIIPSSISVTVYADKPGEGYNIGLSDFTIPGFKGDPRYKKFYARSETEMTGGFVGRASVVSEEDLLVVEEGVNQDLGDKLWQGVSTKVPEEFLFYEEAAEIDFFIENELPKAGERLQEFDVVQKAVLSAPLLSRKDLEKGLAAAYFGEESLENIGVYNLDELTFIIINKDNGISNYFFCNASVELLTKTVNLLISYHPS